MLPYSKIVISYFQVWHPDRTIIIWHPDRSIGGESLASISKRKLRTGILLTGSLAGHWQGRRGGRKESEREKDIENERECVCVDETERERKRESE